MAEIGAKGGSVRSEAKATAARANAKLPRKKKSERITLEIAKPLR